MSPMPRPHWLAAALPFLLGAGFYHPSDVAPLSAQYARAADKAGARFEALQTRADATALALIRYEEALDLLGPRAPAAERERLESLKVTFNRQRAVLEAFAGTMLEDFDTEFTRAMETAAAKLGNDVVQCEAMVSRGPAMPGLRPRLEANPACKGIDHNADVARAMDADPKLAEALDEILALQWPTLDLPAQPQAPIGGSARWIDVDALLRKGASTPLKKIAAADDAERLDFQADIESGVSTEDLEKHVAAAQAITARTARRRASLAAPVVAASEGVLARWSKKGEPATGWCANPATLGGCTGDDATGELVERLLANGKVLKALP